MATHTVEATKESGELIFSVIPEIEKTAKLVEEISASSMEQTNGVNQINDTVQQLNNITQQNAAASEEISSSSEQLASQAAGLRNILTFFKL